MQIRFNDQDWERITQDWTGFWHQDLDQPMVWIQIWDPSKEPIPGRKSFMAQYPLQLSPEEIIELETRHLEGFDFIGDAFPKLFVNFGAGSAAAYFGAIPKVEPTTVWFDPMNFDLQYIKLAINRTGEWYQRIHAILDAALARWQDKVQVSNTDIGGNLDILASLRGTEQLLIDCYEQPEWVAGLCKQITTYWLQIYQEEADKILKVCRGTSPWAPVFSQGYTYMLQSDFSYMISPQMFERFVMPDLCTCCDFLDDPFYHLDGKGQLNHLDMLCSIKKLKGIQWGPGAGQPEAEEWPEVIHKIRAADKLCWVVVSPEGALRIKNEFGGKGFIFSIYSETRTLTLNEANELYRELIRS
ncbi:MAG: hypothetical protein ACE14V_10650 [bacterium]